MASARYTLNIKPEDLKPDEPRQLTRKEKLANWWYYHRLHVGIGAAVLVILIWLAADMLNRTLPDYQIALVTEQYIPETVVTELGDALSAFGLDLNGDGQALVQVSGYQLSLGGEEETGASASSSSTVTTTVDAYTQMAGFTTLSGDVTTAPASSSSPTTRRPSRVPSSFWPRRTAACRRRARALRAWSFSPFPTARCWPAWT